jgi:hypothetical protein
MPDTRPGTIFCDIDGCLLKHRGPGLSGVLEKPPTLLEGTREKFDTWERKGYRIILTTGRKESMREHTEAELTLMGIYYDLLIMGIGGGPRYLINDRKPGGKDTAFAINLDRDEGIKNAKL